MMSPILILIIFCIFTGLVQLLAGRKWASYIGLASSVIGLLYFLFLLTDLDLQAGLMYPLEFKWIPGLEVSFSLGMDSQNLLLLLLVFLIMPVGQIASITGSEQKSTAYYCLMSLGQAALIGFFSAQNPFTFYLFFELALIPFYLMVLMYGGEYRRRAVFKFFMYTVFGSFLMLAGIIYYYTLLPAGGSNVQWATMNSMPIGIENQYWIFAALLIAFAIKSPLFPFHTWQAELYTQGDRPAIIIIAAVLSKMGLFGFIRFYPLCADAIQNWSYFLIPICIAGILYGAIVAWRQSIMTKILAYSSLSHIGMIAAAIFTGTVVGIQGALFQMFTHGILAASLFYVVDVIIRRTGENNIYGSAGMAKIHPRLAVYFFIIVLASVGLPLTNGFIGEFYMLWGLTEKSIWYGAFAGLSIILGAIYMLRFYQKSMFGDLQTEHEPKWHKLELTEDYVLLVSVILILSFGFFPATWMDLTQQAANHLLTK
ncbi:MAG: NADH-quinone oxidoreductase subunit M [Saprospiraceae bacterium]|nr:NADH-quinone oxidoreductase subunit M [Saprospiraceae bacterium]